MQPHSPKAALSHELFERLSQFISAECGIKRPLSKKAMLEARLMKRLRALGMKSYKEYCTLLFSPEGRAHEFVPMLDVVTAKQDGFFPGIQALRLSRRAGAARPRTEDGGGRAQAAQDMGLLHRRGALYPGHAPG